VIGEALIDLIRRPGQPDDARVGGSPLNVAVGLSRLGVPVELLTHLGTDTYADLVTGHLDANGVGVVEGSVAHGATSTALATIGADGAATYDFAIEWALPGVPRRMPELVHTGSIGAVLEPGGRVVEETLRAVRSTATVSYDPNVRPQLMGDPVGARAKVEALVAVADVVKASDEDAAWLYPGLPVPEVARHWLGLGPALVVVTRGGEGAYAATAGEVVDVIAPRTTVADTIGAGDSFMAALLAALADAGVLGREREAALRALAGDELRRVLTFAAACAAVTVSRPGADPPRRVEMPG
jgi:fructokinase